MKDKQITIIYKWVVKIFNPDLDCTPIDIRRAIITQMFDRRFYQLNSPTSFVETLDSFASYLNVGVPVMRQHYNRKSEVQDNVNLQTIMADVRIGNSVMKDIMKASSINRWMNGERSDPFYNSTGFHSNCGCQAF